MKKTVEKLIRHSKANFDWKRFEQLDYEDIESFIINLDDLFQDALFDYHFECVKINNVNDLPETFITKSDDTRYVHRIGTKFINEENNAIDLETLIGQEVINIIEYPKPLSSRAFIEVIFSLYPKINFLLVMAVPFILIPAFYSNLFNTRLIFNELASTLLYVTIAFVLLWGGEYTLKYFIKKHHLNMIDRHALKIERYLLSLMPFFKHKDVLTKIRMVESNRKVIWDSISSVIVDFMSFFIVVLILFSFIGYYAMILLSFYVAIIIVSTFLRYRNYKLYLELESAQQDLLNERISYYKNVKQLRFLDTEATLNHFEQACKKSFNSDHGIAQFNFNWDEFIRLSSFLASFVLFTTIFFSSKENAEIFNVLIALLILNGRASASMISMVTKSFFILVSTYHLDTALKDVFEKIDKTQVKKGLNIDRIAKINLKDLTLSIDERVLINNINATFHAGNIYGFFGNVGSGKSTLMAAILQNHTEYSGLVQYNDFYNASDIDRQFFAKRVSYLDPTSDFIRGSIYSNFYIRGLRDDKLIAQICAFIFTDTNIDYEFIYQRDITTLEMSTGQKRKLLLFMSLDKSKKLIILDEAFSNLSAADSTMILKHIKREVKGAITLIVTHDSTILNQLDNLYEVKAQALHKVKSSVVRL